MPRQRMVLATTALCVALAGCTAGTEPAGQPPASRPPATDPPALAAPSPTGTGSATPTPEPAFRGAVTYLPSRDLPSPVAAGLLGEPAAVPVPGAVVVGFGDGAEVLVTSTPMPTIEPGTPFDPTPDDPAYRSGLGLWSPSGEVEWVLPAPDEPEIGPTVTAGTASADWVAWLSTDSGWWADVSYTLWARPRAGGAVRELARSDGVTDDGPGPLLFDRDPVILGDTLFWLGEVDGKPGSSAAWAVPLDGSAPPRLAAEDAVTLWRDECAPVDQLELFVVAGTLAGGPAELRRVVVDRAGAVVTETTVLTPLLGPGDGVRHVAACGGTVATDGAVAGNRADRGAWLEVTHGDEVRTFAWRVGVGSSVADLTVTPELVAWATYNGEDEGGRYLFDLRESILYQLPRAAGFAHVAADAAVVHWVETASDGRTGVRVVAPLVPRGGKA